MGAVEVIRAVAVVVVMLVYVMAAGMIPWTLLFRVRAYEFVFGFGPVLFAPTLGQIRVVLKAIPLNAYAQFAPPEGSDLRGVGSRSYEDVTPAMSLASPFVASVAILLPSLFILGPEDTMGHFLSGIPQLLVGAITPFGTGEELARRAGEYLLAQPLVAAAIISTKFASLQFIPYAGSGIVAPILRLHDTGRILDGLYKVMSGVTQLIGAVLAFGWLAAVISAFTG